MKAPSHLHNEMENFTATSKVSCTLAIFVTVAWYFYCIYKVALYDEVRQVLHAIKQRLAREKCACLLLCMPWPYVLHLTAIVLLTLHTSGLAGCALNFCACTFLLIIKPTRFTNYSNLFFGIKLYMFRTVPLSIIRSFSLYTQQWYMSYTIAVCTVKNS